MSYQINDHKLEGPDVSFVSSPNVSGKFKPGRPDTIVIHYTAGPSADSAVRTFKKDSSDVSAHLVIDFDGGTTQMVDFDTIGWHCGKSKAPGRSGLNSYSIGFEIVNAGILSGSEGDSELESWWGKKYDASEAVWATHRNQSKSKWWHKYTDKQIEVVKDICKALIDAYDIKYIYGHEEISPGRKIDPGPAFPLDELRAELLGHEPATETADDSDDAVGGTGKVAASSLNIRSAPSASGDKLADALPNGQEVEVMQEQDGWYKVKTTVEIEGWVSAKYIEMD